jgi:hypothetical protein
MNKHGFIAGKMYKLTWSETYSRTAMFLYGEYHHVSYARYFLICDGRKEYYYEYLFNNGHIKCEEL